VACHSTKNIFPAEIQKLVDCWTNCVAKERQYYRKMILSCTSSATALFNEKLIANTDSPS
jgi:hypothetical protein